MLYTNLRFYYECVHVMHTYMKYTVEDIEKMYPYEREIYMLMYKNDKEKQQKELESKRRGFNGKL